MSCGESADERQLSSHDRCSDDPCELLGVLSRIGGMSTFDSQDLKDRLLGSEDGTTTHGPDFNAGHCNSHMKVLPVVGPEAGC